MNAYSEKARLLKQPTTIYLVCFARWASIQGEEIRGNLRVTMAHNGVKLMGQGVNYDALPNLNLFSTVPRPTPPLSTSSIPTVTQVDSCLNLCLGFFIPTLSTNHQASFPPSYCGLKRNQMGWREMECSGQMWIKSKDQEMKLITFFL